MLEPVKDEEQRYKILRGNAIRMLELDRVYQRAPPRDPAAAAGDG